MCGWVSQCHMLQQFVGAPKKPRKGLCLHNTELVQILSKVADNYDEFTMRQKVGMTIGSSLTAEELFQMDDKDVSADYLKRHGVCAGHLVAAEVRIANLKARGADLDMLLQMGFDATDVVLHEELASQFAVCFGEESCKQAFLRNPSSAVMLAGSFAQTRFGISTTDLLRVVGGLEEESVSVLRQLGGGALLGVDARELTQHGLGRRHLAATNLCPLQAGRDMLGDPSLVAALTLK